MKTLRKVVLCITAVAGCSGAAAKAPSGPRPDAQAAAHGGPEYEGFYAALARSTTATAPESAWDLDDAGAEDLEVRRWSLRQALPAQHSTLRGTGRGRIAVLLAAPGVYGRAALLADSGPFHRTMPVQGEGWLMGANGGWLEAAPFVSDGRGSSFSARWPIDDGLAFDVAYYGATTPNPWELHGRVHVIDAEIVRGERGSTVILAASRLDGAQGSPSATSILLGMAERFEARRDDELKALEASLRTTHAVDATQEATWVFPTFDTDTHTIRAFFYRRIAGKRDGGGVAMAAAATEYTANLQGRLLRVRRFLPRTEASWERPTGLPRSLAPTASSHSRLVRVLPRTKLDIRPATEKHAQWELSTLLPMADMPPGKSAAEAIEVDVRALQWDGDETWWPVHGLEPPNPVLSTWGLNWGPIRQLPANLGDSTPTVIRLVKREVEGNRVSAQVLPKGDVLPDLLVALRTHFGAELDRQEAEMTRVRDAIGKAGDQAPTGHVNETVSAHAQWLPQSQRAQVFFVARQAERRLGPYNGGPAPIDPDQQSVYAWDSTFAMVYEVDLEGVVHRRDIYAPRGHENWSIPKP